MGGRREAGQQQQENHRLFFSLRSPYRLAAPRLRAATPRWFLATSLAAGEIPTSSLTSPSSSLRRVASAMRLRMSAILDGVSLLVLSPNTPVGGLVNMSLIGVYVSVGPPTPLKQQCGEQSGNGGMCRGRGKEGKEGGGGGEVCMSPVRSTNKSERQVTCA